jgi:hypothetical protein
VALPWAAQAQSADCRAPELPAHPLAARSASMTWFEQMPESCLRTMFMECAAAAHSHLLDIGSATFCSVGYEALLKRGFGGDFHALIGWWRSQREAPSY